MRNCRKHSKLCIPIIANLNDKVYEHSPAFSTNIFKAEFYNRTRKTNRNDFNALRFCFLHLSHCATYKRNNLFLADIKQKCQGREEKSLPNLIVTADFINEHSIFCLTLGKISFLLVFLGFAILGRESDAENHRRIRRWESFRSVPLPDFTASSRKENWGIS